MDYIQLSMDDYIQSKNEIKENIGGIVKSFVRIGWQLTRIDKSRAYELDGYKSIAEFAKREYDMNPFGVSRFMAVYEKYSIPGDTPELQEQYRDFKFAQLVEMLQLPEADRDMFLPEAKREDIREMQRFNRENQSNPENLLNWQQDQPQDKLKNTILEFFREHRETLNELFGSEAYRTGNIKELVEIINPSGNRSYRKGTVFLMMYSTDKGIMVKEFGKETSDITWEQFFSITQEIFGGAAAGSRTYETYFGIKPEPEEAPKAEKRPEKPTESQKTAPEKKITSHSENAKADTDFAPAQKEQETEEESQENASGQPEGPTTVPQVDTQESTEAQIPGQDNIQNHPEYMPEPEEPEPVTDCNGLRTEEPQSRDPEPVTNCHGLEREDEAATNCSQLKTRESNTDEEHQEETAMPDQEVIEKPLTRKEYLDTLTAYGAAGYLAAAIAGFRSQTFNRLTMADFWEFWLDVKVDHAGRPWID